MSLELASRKSVKQYNDHKKIIYCPIKILAEFWYGVWVYCSLNEIVPRRTSLSVLIHFTTFNSPFSNISRNLQISTRRRRFDKVFVVDVVQGICCLNSVLFQWILQPQCLPIEVLRSMLSPQLVTGLQFLQKSSIYKSY